jgi:hypothetical protein
LHLNVAASGVTSGSVTLAGQPPKRSAQANVAQSNEIFSLEKGFGLSFKN